MFDDVEQTLLICVATCIPQDEAAYAILHQTFIRGFHHFVVERKQRKQAEAIAQGVQPELTTLLEDAIHYVIQNLPAVVEKCNSLSFLLSPEKKEEIVRKFLTMDRWELLTELAKRPTIQYSIRQVLHQRDTHGSHRAIDSNKVDAVFNGFYDQFLKSYAGAYQFFGSFVDYVMNSFTKFHYKSNTKDIWASVQAPDFAKREAETNMSRVKVIDPIRTDDLLVHDLFVNISECNDLMFKHAGQYIDSKGVNYDAFYLFLNMLVGYKIDAINQRLEESGNPIRLVLIDEADRKETRYDLPARKGIVGKIMNAKDLLPYVFERVRAGDWSPSDLVELRDQCFIRGKKDQDGRNCVWRNVKVKGETSRYLDRNVTYLNFKAFEILFKGTLSCYTLMTALEDRGYSLVDSYPDIHRVLSDKEMVRSIDYLSALEHLDLIDALHSEVKPQEDAGDLHLFEDMVYEYAGSKQNGHPQIRENKYLAFSRGLLGENTRVKQAGDYQSLPEQLRSVAMYLSAMPRCYLELALEKSKMNALPPVFGPPCILSVADVTVGMYSSPYTNLFFKANPTLAKYYLYDHATEGKPLPSYAWRLMYATFPSARFDTLVMNEKGTGWQSNYCMYIPMMDRFLFVPLDGSVGKNSRLRVYNPLDLTKASLGSLSNGVYTQKFYPSTDPIPDALIAQFLRKDSPTPEEMELALNSTIGFHMYVGIQNMGDPNIVNKLKSIPMYGKYRPLVDMYSKWMTEVSTIQNSIVDLLYLMLSWGIYVCRTSLSGLSRFDEEQAQILMESLMKSEFTESNLTWFFSCLSNSLGDSQLKKVNQLWGTVLSNDVKFVPMDLSVINIIVPGAFGPVAPDSLTGSILRSMQGIDSIPQRFVLLYNSLNTRHTVLSVLRDAYDLLFNVMLSNLATLGCELDSQFGIEQVIQSMAGNAPLESLLDNKYILIDTIQSEDLQRFVEEARRDTWQHFATLGTDMLTHLKDCRHALSSLVDYEVTSSKEVSSKMQQYGSAFFAAGRYMEPEVEVALSMVRNLAKTDDAGFFMLRNSYFRGRNGTSMFYVHSTGRLLEVTSSKEVIPASFNFSIKEDCLRYNSIIQEGFNGG